MTSLPQDGTNSRPSESSAQNNLAQNAADGRRPSNTSGQSGLSTSYQSASRSPRSSNDEPQGVVRADCISTISPLSPTKQLRDAVSGLEMPEKENQGFFGCLRCRLPSFQPSMELKDLHFGQLTKAKYGADKLWKDLTIPEQVDLIREALSERSILIDPNSDYMKGWDVVIMLCLVFTALVTPYEIAFLAEAQFFLYILNRIVDFIFVKDIIMQFFLKVKKQTKQGTVWLRSRKKIAGMYIKGWFFIDILAIVPYDDITDILASRGGDSEGLEKLKIMRLLRVLRLVKLVRIIKASRVVKRWENRISMRSTSRYLIKFTILIMVSCHWMACVWGFFGILEGSNLVCRHDIGLDTEVAGFDEIPERMYFIRASDDADPYNPDHWVGQSWVVRFADGRAGSNPYDPCDAGLVYLASIYWAVMTITSIGYGDIIPVTSLEYLVCSMCMMASSILWAYIIGAACSIMTNLDPEQTEFEQRMDGFNAMANDQDLPSDIRQRGREYLREERFHEHYLRNRDAAQTLGNFLKGTVSRQMASHYLDNIWFFKRSEEKVREDVANRFIPVFYEKREIVVQMGKLCVVERGAVGRAGRILVPWSYWGDDVLIREKALCQNRSSITLTYTEIVTLSRDDLSAVLVDYPHELSWFRRCAAIVALSRAVQVYRDEEKWNMGRNPQLGWVYDLFDPEAMAKGAAESEAKHQAKKDGLEQKRAKEEAPITAMTCIEPSIGQVVPPMEERVQHVLAILERAERRCPSELKAHKVEKHLERMHAQCERIQALRDQNAASMDAAGGPVAQSLLEQLDQMQARMSHVQTSLRCAPGPPEVSFQGTKGLGSSAAQGNLNGKAALPHPPGNGEFLHRPGGSGVPANTALQTALPIGR